VCKVYSWFSNLRVLLARLVTSKCPMCSPPGSMFVLPKNLFLVLTFPGQKPQMDLSPLLILRGRLTTPLLSRCSPQTLGPTCISVRCFPVKWKGLSPIFFHRPWFPSLITRPALAIIPSFSTWLQRPDLFCDPFCRPRAPRSRFPPCQGFYSSIFSG